MKPASINPGLVSIQGLLQRGKQFHVQGRLGQAEQNYSEVIRRDPRNFEAWRLLSVIALQMGQPARSVEFLQQALALNPGFAPAHIDLGAALYMLGRLDEALASCDRALELKPGDPGAACNRGNVLSDLGRHEEALASFDRAITAAPDYAEAFCNRGHVLRTLGRPQAALASYDRAISLKSDYAKALHARGLVLKDLKRGPEAIAAFDRAIQVSPGYGEVFRDRAAVLYDLGRLEEAVASADGAIALRPADPLAHYNRATALKDLKRLDEALASYDEALGLQPDHVEALHNRGNVLSDQKRHAEALASYEKAIVLRPDDAKPRYNASLCRLAMGHLDSGLRGYEWRRDPDGRPYHRTYDQALWTGDQPLGGKTVLIYAEQGLGDTIQFCRYARLAEDAGANVVLAVQPALTALMSSLSSTIRCVDLDAAPGAFDLHAPMLSLPLAFGTTLASIPAKGRYLSAGDARRGAWAGRLGASARPRVGLAWSGNPGHGNDSNRSMRFAQIEPILAEDAGWVSLQKQVRPEDAAGLAGNRSIKSIHEDLHDFVDTAAVIELLDLVVTVDTSVAHLAGALGKPVWILLPFNADWRWLIDRADSPWYPSARLFRQAAPGDWDAVVRDLRRALQEWLHDEDLRRSGDAA